MGTRKIVREFRRKAKSAGYCVGAITSDSGHLHAIVMHGTTLQRITLPSSPASPEQSIKHALDEMRRFRTAHETSTQHELHLHGPGGQKDVAAQTARQPPN